MSALPVPPQRLPLTGAAYLAPGEDPDGARYERQEGCLVMSPNPDPEHQLVVGELTTRLHDQVPDDLCALFRIDVDLPRAPPTGPGTVRAPDVVVLTRDVLERHRGPVTAPFRARVDLDALV